MYYLSHHIQSSNISEFTSYIMYISKVVFPHVKYKYNFFSMTAHNEALGLLPYVCRHICEFMTSRPPNSICKNEINKI